MTKTKLFITGVSGFIGSNLAKKMVQSNYEVIGIDNFSYGKVENIEELKSYKNFKFIEGDVLNYKLYEGLKADFIIHLASQKIPRYTNSIRTLEENELMTKNVIRFSLETKARLIFASTSDIYGKNTQVPFSEESDIVLGQTTVKRWAYATSKIASEHKILAYADGHDLKYTIVRFFGSYGINQNLTWWGGPQSVFIDKAINNMEIELHGDGLQTRTFSYIDDTVEALKLCIEKKEAENEIFNVASEPDQEISISDLAHLIWKLVRPQDKSPKIKYIPYTSFGNYEDVRRRVPNITKLKTVLGFEAKYNLEMGLKKTIEWQMNYTNNNVTI